LEIYRAGSETPLVFDFADGSLQRGTEADSKLVFRRCGKTFAEIATWPTASQFGGVK
jgi:hypothetical protein